MLTFSSGLTAVSDCNLDNILGMLNEWFVQSDLGTKWMTEKQCSPFDVYKGEEEYKDTAAGVTVDILNIPDVFLVQFILAAKGADKNTFCIFRTIDGKKVFYTGEQVDISSLDGDGIILRMPGQYAREIIQRFIWSEYQEPFDTIIPVTDKPIWLNGSGLAAYKDILSGRASDYQMPYLYIPYGFSDAAGELASAFTGRLHVFGEGTPLVKDKWADAVGTEYSYETPVLRYPGKEIAKLDGTNVEDLTGEILAIFRDDMQLSGADKAFSIMHIREERLLSKIDGNNEMSQVFESIISDKDEEIKSLKSELSSLKNELHDEKLKSGALMDGMDKSGADEKPGMFEMTEVPKYDHEIEDIILRVLEKERASMDGDKELVRCRKYHVLCDILAHNFPSDTGTGLRKLLKEVFADGRLTRDGIGRLQSAGFSVEHANRQSHYKIMWQDDERYMTVYSATPSDYRSGRNGASDFANQCFGY